MQVELAWRDEADQLIALHGPGAIGTLVGMISDAVRLCDDQAVSDLDHILQLVESRLEESWRQPPIWFIQRQGARRGLQDRRQR